MNKEVDMFPLLVRLSAYSGYALRFGIVGFADDEPVLSVTTSISCLPPGKTLLETATDMGEILMSNLVRNMAETADRYHVPDNIEWVGIVSCGVCLN